MVSERSFACVFILLTTGTEACTDDNSVVEGVVAFVADTSLQSIKRTTDDSISVADWYYTVSRGQMTSTNTSKLTKLS